MANVAILVGRVGRDPEIRHTTKGEKVVSFSLATPGYKKGETDWHNIVVSGKSADFVAEYVKKGASLYVHGRITCEKWTDKSGGKRETTKIIADRVEFAGSANRSESSEPTSEPFVPGDEDVPF